MAGPMSGPPSLPDDDFERLHAPLLAGFPRLVARLGGDAGELYQAAGIACVAEGELPVLTYRQMVHLLEQAAQRLSCPDFGMRLARAGGGRALFGPLGQAMSLSRSLGQAIALVSRHSYAHSLAVRIWLDRGLTGQHVFVGHDLLLPGLADRAQAMEFLLLAGRLAAQELTGGWARMRWVHFRHPQISPASVYRRNFACEVSFCESQDGALFADRDLAYPIPTHDPAALALATAGLEQAFARHQPPLHAEVRGIVMRSLAGTVCDNAQIAAALDLHPRTLHRRLTEQGTSFRRIKDEVRRDLLVYYLTHTDLALSWISEKLGFAEQAVMTRKCRQWLHDTPTAIRQNARGAEAGDGRG